MAKIGPGFFYSLSVDPGLVCRRCKVFSLKPTKPNKFNQSKTTIPLLMKLGNESIEFHAMQATTRDGVTRKRKR